MNGADFIVAIGVAALALLAFGILRRNKKHGRSGCGCCTACGACTSSQKKRG